MKNSTKNVALTSVDVLFTTEEEREETKWEKVQNIPLSELHPFRDHPFNVVDDDKMQETVDSIREYGVLVPIIARPKEAGGYAEEFDCGGSAQQPGYDIKRSRTKYDKELSDGIAERSETR